MEFTCTKSELNKGVQAVEKIVLTRSTLPIIGNILLETKKNELIMSANNLEIGIEVKIKAQVKADGAILIPAKTLGSIVSRLPEGPVSFKIISNGIMQISYGESSSNIHTLPADEFPLLARIKDGKTIKLKASIFSKMISHTLFAVSASEDKYILNGALLEIGKSGGDGSNFRMITTDGYRLAKYEEKVSLPAKMDDSVIIPAKALAELARIIGDGDEELKITLASDQISFEYDNAYLVSKIIQGQFPDYKKVIPKNLDLKIDMPLDEFLGSLERAAVIAAASANIIRLEVKGNKLHVVANTPEIGNIDEVVAVNANSSKKAKIAFNVRLIIDALKVLDSKNVSLELGSALSPGVMRPQTQSGDYTYIVMPIRTTETVE